jgi:hypothetical protein
MSRSSFNRKNCFSQVEMLSFILASSVLIAFVVGAPSSSGLASRCDPARPGCPDGLVPFTGLFANNGMQPTYKCFCVLKYVGKDEACTYPAPPSGFVGKATRCMPGYACGVDPNTSKPVCLLYPRVVHTKPQLGEYCRAADGVMDCDEGLACVTADNTKSYCLPKGTA